MQIVIATFALGGLGLLFGVALALAHKVFSIQADEKRTAIRKALPGTNCGVCGFPGCDALADAIFTGQADASACLVGGEGTFLKIKNITGVPDEKLNEKKTAKILCQGDTLQCKEKFAYNGIENCVSASLVENGFKACEFACLGLGTCVSACPTGAISVDKRLKMAIIEESKCVGCGKCVETCPKDVIQMQAAGLPVQLLCRAAVEGIMVRNTCHTGCIGCASCAAQCRFRAITMQNHIPQFDYTKCTGCLICAEVCPTSVIKGEFQNRLIAVIDNSCIGCGLCKKACLFDAIVGTTKHVHYITQACTGCKRCVEKCVKNCISLSVRKYPRDNNDKNVLASSLR